MTDLPRLVGATKPDSTVPMEIWRKGKKETLRVKVGEMPAASDEEAGPSSKAPKDAPADKLGLKVGPVESSAASELGIEGGVQVVQANGPAADAGLAAGDIIVTINDVDIKGPEQYAKIVSGLDKGRAAALLVVRGDQSQWITVTPKK
jgi:serine protease Do